MLLHCQDRGDDDVAQSRLEGMMLLHSQDRGGGGGGGGGEGMIGLHCRDWRG